MTPPPDLLGEFVSTFKEWHYFVGGGCIGFLLGWLAHVILHRAVYA